MTPAVLELFRADKTDEGQLMGAFLATSRWKHIKKQQKKPG
jgi:hypothetical protein